MKRDPLHFLSALLLEVDIDPPHAGGNFHEHAAPGGHGPEGHGGDGHGSPGALGLSIPMYAFLFATVSGMSMPIGSALGIKLSPVLETTNASWMAFGSGALLFAVSVELYGHAIHSYHTGHMPGIAMLVLMVLSLVGAFVYTKITRLFATIEEEKDHDDDQTEAPTEDAEDSRSAPTGSRRRRNTWTSTKDEEEAGDDLRSDDGASLKASARSSGSAHGPRRGLTLSDLETTLNTPAERLLPPRMASELPSRGQKLGGLNAMLRMSKEEEAKAKSNMAKLRWKNLREAVKAMHITMYWDTRAKDSAAERSWTLSLPDSPRAFKSLVDLGIKKDQWKFWKLLRTKWSEQGPVVPQVNEAHVQKCRECALNIFLMLLVDGIPEGILMGFMAAEGFLSLTFVLSLLVANFPEAFAASTLMVDAQFPTYQTLGMWTGLMLLVGSLAGLSCFLLLDYGGGGLSVDLLKASVEGLAGGAMISGIAAVMLPEAFEKTDKRGRIVQSSGFLCTLGFLMSVGLKIVLH